MERVLMRRCLARAALVIFSLATHLPFCLLISLWIDRIIVWGDL